MDPHSKARPVSQHHEKKLILLDFDTHSRPDNALPCWLTFSTSGLEFQEFGPPSKKTNSKGERKACACNRTLRQIMRSCLGRMHIVLGEQSSQARGDHGRVDRKYWRSRKDSCPNLVGASVPEGGRYLPH